VLTLIPNPDVMDAPPQYANSRTTAGFCPQTLHYLRFLSLYRLLLLARCTFIFPLLSLQTNRVLSPARRGCFPKMEGRRGQNAQTSLAQYPPPSLIPSQTHVRLSRLLCGPWCSQDCYHRGNKNGVQEGVVEVRSCAAFSVPLMLCLILAVDQDPS